MASGLEIAGLALGAFPVFEQFVQGYSRGSESLKAWLRFKSVFKKLQHAINIERTLYISNIRILCREAGIEDVNKIMQHLEKNTPLPEWIKSDFEKYTRVVLGGYHEAYIKTSDLIRETLEEIRNELGLNETCQMDLLRDLSTDDSSVWITSHVASYWDRLIKLWTKPAVNELIKHIRSHNKYLERLLLDAKHEQNLIQRSQKNFHGERIIRLRRGSQLLHLFLKDVWPSAGSHYAQVFLEPHPSLCSNVNPDASPFTHFFGMRKVEEESYWHFISFKNVENDSFAGPNTMRISEEPPVAAEGDETLASAVQQWFYESHSRCMPESSMSAMLAPQRQPQIMLPQSKSVTFWFRHEECPTTLQGEETIPIPQLFEESIGGQPNALRTSGAPMKLRLALNFVNLFAQTMATAWCSSWQHGKIRLPFSRLSEEACRRPARGRLDVYAGYPQVIHQFPCDAVSINETFGDALTRLGVLLEEICFAARLEEQNFYDGAVQGQSDEHGAVFLAARKWLDPVKLEMGTNYWNAVHACLSLSMTADQQSEQAMWQEFHEKIMFPLHTLWQNLEAMPV